MQKKLEDYGVEPDPFARPKEALFFPPLRGRIFVSLPPEIVRARLMSAFQQEHVRNGATYRGQATDTALRSFIEEGKWRFYLGARHSPYRDGTLIEAALWDLHGYNFGFALAFLGFMLLVPGGLYAYPLRFLFVILFFIGFFSFVRWATISSRSRATVSELMKIVYDDPAADIYRATFLKRP